MEMNYLNLTSKGKGQKFNTYQELPLDTEYNLNFIQAVYIGIAVDMCTEQ